MSKRGACNNIWMGCINCGELIHVDDFGRENGETFCPLCKRIWWIDD